MCRYLYITIVYNITYSVALFALFMFYLGTHDLLAPFNPLMKFVLVKSVVFFTFWQARTPSETVACTPAAWPYPAPHFPATAHRLPADLGPTFANNVLHVEGCPTRFPAMFKVNPEMCCTL